MGGNVLIRAHILNAKAQRRKVFSTPMRPFTGFLSPQPAEEIDDVERVDVFERRPSDGVMAAGQEHFPGGHVVAGAVVEEYPRQVW
jgi:hypothetical protein